MILVIVRGKNIHGNGDFNHYVENMMQKSCKIDSEEQQILKWEDIIMIKIAGFICMEARFMNC